MRVSILLWRLLVHVLVQILLVHLKLRLVLLHHLPFELLSVNQIMHKVDVLLQHWRELSGTERRHHAAGFEGAQSYALHSHGIQEL